MDQKPHEVEQTTSILPAANKPCSESFTFIKKSHIHEIPHVDANLVTPTPKKTEATVNVRCKKEPAELPEKYKLLSELFDRMTTSVRLLNLGKKLPTFQNICHVVETLSGRKFSCKNLAQIKFIFPEAVQTDKILLQNKKTLCMEPDIKVTLLLDVIEGHVELSDYLALSRLFSSRLFKFANAHPEDDDVPEAELPEPFNRQQIPVSANSLPMNSSARILPNLGEIEPLNASHFSPSFRRRFSKEVEPPMKTELPQSPISLLPVKEMGSSTCLESVKPEKDLQVANGNTPIKKPLAFTDINIGTPDLSTPKRSVAVATEDGKSKSMVSQKALASSLFAKRSLDFSNFDEESVFLEGNTTSNSGSSAEFNENSDLKPITEKLT